MPRSRQAIRRIRRWAWIAAALLFMLAALAAAPFLLTTRLANLALGRFLRVNHVSVGSASLSPFGALILRDIVIHDRGAKAQEPLASAREIDVAFGWRALIARKLGRVRANEVTLYARANGHSQLSLIDFAYELSGSPSVPSPGVMPFWIGTLEVHGRIRPPAVIPVEAAKSDFPMTLLMTMSGERAAPLRHFMIEIGGVPQGRENISAKASLRANQSGPGPDGAFAVVADVATQTTAGATRLLIHRLIATDAAITLDASTVRHFVTILPPEVQGRIEARLAKLSATGTIDLARPAKRNHLSGNVIFAGLRVRIAGDPKMAFILDGLDGAARIDSNLPLATGGAIRIERLHAKRSTVSIDADILRRYAAKLATNLHGPIVADFRALDVAGEIKSGRRNALGFNGSLALEDLSARSSADSPSAFELDRLTLMAGVEVRLDRWAPAKFKVRGGATRWVKFSYRGNAVNNVDATWRADGERLTFDRIVAQIFGGEISGSPQFDLATREIRGFDLRIKSIDAHQALVNLSPEHLDADGSASGILHLAMSAQGELSGHADLSFDAPGVLRIGQIEELQRMLAGNFGAEMASLAMHDLEHYPFKQGTLHLESAGANSELKINFVRQPKTAGDKTVPHKELIDGREVWVGSLVVPKIDLTIPIAGKSFAEILSMVSGFHPLIEAVGKHSGK